LHIKPAGKYLRAFCKGSWDRLPDRYKEILAYAQKQGLSLTGYSYEMGINETVIDDFNDYITQIEIQIKSG
jgi:effector-binding domain-containing protein